METGLQIGAIVVVVAGFVMIVIYQRWKKTSRTQADLDSRSDEEEAPYYTNTVGTVCSASHTARIRVIGPPTTPALSKSDAQGVWRDVGGKHHALPCHGCVADLTRRSLAPLEWIEPAPASPR
jgi:hypothetical protein